MGDPVVTVVTAIELVILPLLSAGVVAGRRPPVTVLFRRRFLSTCASLMYATCGEEQEEEEEEVEWTLYTGEETVVLSSSSLPAEKEVVGDHL